MLFLLTKSLRMAPTVDFIQIIYNQEHQKECYPFARVLFNNKLTHFFENTIIAAEVLSSKADKISVCSWKLRQKMRWNVCRPRELTEEVLKTDYEVLSFTCNTKYHTMIEAADKWHPGFSGIMKRLLNSIGQLMPSEIKTPIYQNHFAASYEIYKRYVNEWLIPIMNVMDDDKECWLDSGYSQLAKTDALRPERLQELIGVPYYPMHPFILERLFSIFCHNKKIKVDYL